MANSEAVYIYCDTAHYLSNSERLEIQVLYLNGFRRQINYNAALNSDPLVLLLLDPRGFLLLLPERRLL